MGDVAMMQVAVDRLSELWPHAQIEVITAGPELLSRFCPCAAPISSQARSAWLSGRSLIGGLHRKLPSVVSIPLQKLERLLWLRCPAVTEFGARIKAAILRRESGSPESFRKRLTGASLLVMSGAGVLNDAFADAALPLLDELEFALNAGIPVVAFGRGLGPITEPALMAKAHAVLPRLKFIGLREGRAALPLLLSLEVPRDIICVTGDDALELAYRPCPDRLGDGIGVNLRLAGYAGTDDETVKNLREPLLLAARKLNTFLVSVPISLHHSDSDEESARKLLGAQNKSLDAEIEGPKDVIRLIGGCRVVVTGSYHAGVFALAQGISVVGLAHSLYYQQKFAGLEAQFPGGCRTIDLRLPITSEEIQSAVLSAWESAETVRDSLLDATVRQIELSRAAYRAVHSLFPLE
jgi:colanic acid/amylovoran biosynthesis protein